MLPMPEKGSVQITEIMPPAPVFLIKYEHTLPHGKRRREGGEEKGLGAYQIQTIFLLVCQLQLQSPYPQFLDGCYGNYFSPTVIKTSME